MKQSIKKLLKSTVPIWGAGEHAWLRQPVIKNKDLLVAALPLLRKIHKSIDWGMLHYKHVMKAGKMIEDQIYDIDLFLDYLEQLVKE